MNVPTLIILLVVAVLLFFAVRHMLRSRKKDGACASCGQSAVCHGNCRGVQNASHSNQ